MRTILLPTDFSNNSINAIDFAMHMFKEHECEFYLLNVQKASAFVSDDLMTASPSVNLYQAIIDASKKSLDNIVESLQRKYNNPKHKFFSIVDYDNFIDSINQTCITKQIDLILMGTKGASGLEKVVFGSNSVRVMQRGKTPVLTIPNNYGFKNLKNGVFISNYLTEYSKEDISTIIKIATMYNLKVDVLHVSENQKLTFEQEQNINSLKHLFKTINYDFIHLKGINVYETVSEYIAANKINLLVMVNRKHSFIERFLATQKVEEFGFCLNIPFLVLPRE